MTIHTCVEKLKQILHYSLATRHRRRLALVGLLAILYLPDWISVLVEGILKGRSDSILNIGFIILGIQPFLKQPNALTQLRAEEDDRWTGYILLVIASVALIIFHSTSPSVTFQAFSVMGLVIGALWSTWGLGFFRQFPVVTLMLLAATYPHLSFITAEALRFVTAPDLLERTMAIVGSWGLTQIGYPAHAEAAIVRMSTGSVFVAPGCSGFDLAFTLCGLGFLLGRLMQTRWRKTLLVMGAGILLAWIANVPRIMLLAIASVYWGKASFDFWHGPIGGQIFAGIVFTIHYYLAMALIGQESPISPPESDPASINNSQI
ncbi:cyanoexosortase C [Alkalinema pantanalense CENA528]|uniref:cyanoexosortase C n=1 Tax=Alkalinema pantanalense TaxID=1620705 RepID=UPI003D6E7EF3